MPALKIYGRRWHMASDMMPLPALAALLIHTIWIIIFGPIVRAYHVFPDRQCSRPGVQYQAVCGGFLAIYGVSWVFELALFAVGCRGMSVGWCDTRRHMYVQKVCFDCLHMQLSIHVDAAVQAHPSKCRNGKQ